MKIKDAILQASRKIDYIDAKSLMKYYLNVDENYIIANGYNSFSNKQIHEYFELVDKVILCNILLMHKNLWVKILKLMKMF